MANVPNLPNLEPFIAAGIDLKTHLPVKMGGNRKHLKEEIKKALRIIDEQDAVNRYVWSNLPCNISSQELERMLYYKGQLCFFYNKDLDEFYFMPYALDGSIDFYGRYNQIHPVPMTSGEDEKKTRQYKALEELLSQIKLKCIYGIPNEMIKPEDAHKYTVLLHDYTKQLSQNLIPRANINDPILDTMSECIPYMRTSLIASSGVKGIRVPDGDSSGNVCDANRQYKNASLDGELYVPIVGNIEFQALNDGQVAKSEEYMLAMQSIDNFRLSTYGIDNGGLFEKKAHELQTEADINGGPVGLVLQDGLSIRQNFCTLCNMLFGTSMWCMPAQNIMGTDTDGDGMMFDNDLDSSQSGLDNENGGIENE